MQFDRIPCFYRVNLLMWMGNVDHLSKNRPDELKIVTSNLGDFTFGISTLTKCVHVSRGTDRYSVQ